MNRSAVWHGGLALGIALLVACSSEPSQRVLRVWHFWSEPAQERAFRAIIAEFERQHRDVRVELVPLQWSDGKAKLQIALASSNPPDVVQVGAEWIAEFAPALLPLDRKFDGLLDSAFASIGIRADDSVRRAVPWTVNARVLFVHQSLGIDSTASWEELVARIGGFHAPPERVGLGLCTSDPHNVLKRVLPWIWAAGGHLLSTAPLSASADSTLDGALEHVRELIPFAVVEQSRHLDARLRRGQIGAVLSGVWMLADSAVCRAYRVLPVIPHCSGSRGESILSGDCFAIARRAANQHDARAFLAYVADWDHAARFCQAVPDAGFPAFRPPSKQALDSLLVRAPQWRPAYAQTRNARLLPPVPWFLDAEQIVEAQLAEFLYGRQNPQETRALLRRQLAKLEGARAVAAHQESITPYQSARAAVGR
ncbi:MAG: extracellular solute-binding protein [Chlorobiota bacterium]|nr:MAG: extracellular solute-binding protein [Chlorobiota bacterium]